MAASMYSDLEIVDLDEVEKEAGADDETWLVAIIEENSNSNSEIQNAKSWKNWNMSNDPSPVRMKKKSLVEKLDLIAKGSPTKYTSPVHSGQSFKFAKIS
jgi:hypothetical protein